MTNVFKKIILLTVLFTIAPAHTKQMGRPTAQPTRPAIQPMPTQPKIPTPIQPAPIQPIAIQPQVISAHNTWTSSAGLVYKSGIKYQTGGTNSINHVLAHAKADSKKPNHSVFSVPEDQILDLIEEAWRKRNNKTPNPKSTGDTYIINMGRSIGTKGETKIQINTFKDTSEVISAYPVQ